jgi:hypothetical protein
MVSVGIHEKAQTLSRPSRSYSELQLFSTVRSYVEDRCFIV